MSANDISNIQISNDVISTIASVAALEVDGVSALSTLLSSNIKDLLSKKNTSKGIVVEVSDNGDVAVTVNMIVKYNYKIQDVALNVQNQVIRAISDMTNYNVSYVNVNVVGVTIPKSSNSKSHRGYSRWLLFILSINSFFCAVICTQAGLKPLLTALRAEATLDQAQQ